MFAKMLTALLLAVLFSVQLNKVVAITEDEINGGVSDILLTREQRTSIEALANEEDPNSPQMAVVISERSLWRDGRVPYVFDSSLASNAVSAIQQAINEYSRQTCIRFVPRSNEADYVRFYRGNGCFSYIGRIGGPQDISIGRGCVFQGTIMHEMFHALGRWHEQSRPDRDLYIRINEENIQQGVGNNFEKVSRAFVTTQGVPYDLSSIMHYSAYAFSRNRRPTIEPLDNTISLQSLGQRSGFSTLDLQHVNTLYCDDKDGSAASWSSWGAWSPCSRTCNGGQRTRTRRCLGGTTCQGSNIDTERCNANTCPRPSSWSSWSSWSVCSATCGGGRQQRARRCVNGNNCVGQSVNFRDCNSQSCPQPATWSSWGSWSACSSTCQGGTRSRRRTCQNGNSCQGRSVQFQFCNSNKPCVDIVSPSTGEWSEWSSCTKSCGGGTRFRTRQCGRPRCVSQQQACNNQDCNPEPELRGLRHEGCYFVNRFSRVLRLFEKLTLDLSDNPTTRQNPIRKCAVAAQQYSYRLFSISVGYCISGSNRLSDYQYVRSENCRDGRGAFASGYFIMDVYSIANPQTFQDSIATELSVTTSAASTNSSTSDLSSSSPQHRYSALILCAALIFGLTLLTISVR